MDMVSGMVSVTRIAAGRADEGQRDAGIAAGGLDQFFARCLRTPRFSASQTMAAPMRHFTEYAGLRPSILASTRALAPSVTRLRRTSGVRPMLQRIVVEDAQTQISQVCTWRFWRSVQARARLGEGGLIDHLGDGAVHLLPHIGERRAGFAARAAFGRVRTFDEAQYFAHGQRIGWAGQQISAFGAAARFDEAGLFESGEDQLEKFLRNLLAPRDLGDLDGFAGALRGEIEDGLQGIFAFDGDVHREKRRQPPIKAERAGTWEGPARCVTVCVDAEHARACLEVQRNREIKSPVVGARSGAAAANAAAAEAGIRAGRLAEIRRGQVADDSPTG